MKISIITPSFNQAHYLRETADSVLSQTGDFDLEWICIDGGSTDGSVEFLKSMNDPRVIWISEKDAGQSDAINKGLSRASGDVVAWLNSDDLYLPGALAAVADAFSTKSNAQWVVGRYQIVSDDKAVIRQRIVTYKERFMRRYAYRSLLRENFIPQMAVFWRREFGQRVGPLDLSLHFTMDYDLWLRMGKLADPVCVDQVLAQFRIHDASKTGVINRAQFDEGYAVARRYTADRLTLARHRLSVAKIVCAYRLLRLLGR